MSGRARLRDNAMSCTHVGRNDEIASAAGLSLDEVLGNGRKGKGPVAAKYRGGGGGKVDYNACTYASVLQGSMGMCPTDYTCQKISC